MKPLAESELRLAVEELVRKARKKLGPPPSEDELLAYYRKELSEEEADRLQELLSHYPDSVRLLADLAGLESLPGDPDYLSDEDLQRDWEELQRKIEAEELAGAGVEAAAGIPGADFVQGHPELGRDVRVDVAKLKTRVRNYQIAAVVVTALFVAHLLFTGLSPLPQPRPQVVTGRLIQSDGQRRGADESAIQIQARPGQSYVLVPALVNVPPSKSYRVEIFEAETGTGGEPVFRQDGIVPGGDGNLYIWLPAGSLRRNRYLIELSGLEPDSEPRLLATYTVDW